MKNIIIIIATLCCIQINAQTTPKEKILYGICTKDSLLQEPYSKWFTENYNNYTANPAVLNTLQTINMKDYSFEIFFGTWCGDSKREVPKMYKVLDALKVPTNKLTLIALGNSDSLYKQSPTKEEVGKSIFRVPVLIVYKNGKEVNRINESPSLSTEKDLLAILKMENYQPNYASFATIHTWLTNGTLADDNTSIGGIANTLRKLVSGENELNSLAYLLQKHGQPKEALKLFRANATIFPESANILSSLGEAYLLNKENQKAINLLEVALQKASADKALFKEILDLLYKAKGVK